MNLHKRIFRELFGDKGYISKDLFEQLFIDGVHLITKIKKRSCLNFSYNKVKVPEN